MSGIAWMHGAVAGDFRLSGESGIRSRRRPTPGPLT